MYNVCKKPQHVIKCSFSTTFCQRVGVGVLAVGDRAQDVCMRGEGREFGTDGRVGTAFRRHLIHLQETTPQGVPPSLDSDENPLQS